MIRWINIALIFGFLILASCRETYWPELDKYEDLVVVDGMISNEPGPYEVRLSMTSSVQNPEFIPFTDGEVEIIDGEGLSERLTQVEPGIFRTDPDGMQGKIGQSYKLRVVLPDDEIYESAYQMIQEPVGIDTVYAEVEDIATDDEYYPLYGYQFYLDTEPAPQDTNYLMWRKYGDYQYQSDFTIQFYYTGSVRVFPNSDSLYTCWGKDRIDDLIVMKTDDLAEPVIKRLPLNFVDTETRKLSMRYSLLVKQLTLEREAFDFFEQISEINNQEGALYTQQPYQVKGNLVNTTNSSRALIGYFLAAGVSEKRIFVNRPSGVDFRYGICELTRRDTEAFSYIRFTDASTWPLFITTTETGALALPHQDCVDCRRKGGDIKRPEFWIDPQ